LEALEPNASLAHKEKTITELLNTFDAVTEKLEQLEYSDAELSSIRDKSFRNSQLQDVILSDFITTQEDLNSVISGSEKVTAKVARRI